jgi:hypothetical protein
MWQEGRFMLRRLERRIFGEGVVCDIPVNRIDRLFIDNVQFLFHKLVSKELPG